MALGVDTICAEIALSLKGLYPHISLECAVPNRAFTESWAEENLRRFTAILAKADKVTYVSDGVKYSRRDLMLRNIYMVDRSETVVAVYTEGETGGTKNTVAYAKSKKKNIIIIEP